MRSANSINHTIPSLLIAETHNNHAFTNRATEYEERMDGIEAYVKRQKKLDLANDFIFEARYVRYADSLNHHIPYLLIAETHKNHAGTNRETDHRKIMYEIASHVERH